MKRRVKVFQPKTVEELVLIINEVWDNLDPFMIDRLCDEFDFRIKMVNELGGESISQFLSANIKNLSDDQKSLMNSNQLSSRQRMMNGCYFGWRKSDRIGKK